MVITLSVPFSFLLSAWRIERVLGSGVQTDGGYPSARDTETDRSNTGRYSVEISLNIIRAWLSNLHSRVMGCGSSCTSHEAECIYSHVS